MLALLHGHASGGKVCVRLGWRFGCRAVNKNTQTGVKCSGHRSPQSTTVRTHSNAQHIRHMAGASCEQGWINKTHQATTEQRHTMILNAATQWGSFLISNAVVFVSSSRPDPRRRLPGDPAPRQQVYVRTCTSVLGDVTVDTFDVVVATASGEGTVECSLVRWSYFEIRQNDIILSTF